MHERDWIQLGLYFGLLAMLTPMLGGYMARVLSGERTFFSRWFVPIEKWIYRFAKIREEEAMNWRGYVANLLIFNAAGLVFLFFLQLLQHKLPLNSQHLSSVPFPLAFNTAVSFITNTNWQAYSGESTLSYLVQAVGLTVQNFLSAATGIAVMVALVRGIKNRESKNLGNFWIDLTRATVHILLPLSIVFAMVLVSQGVVQTIHPYATAKTLEGAEQIIPVGPAASQIAIKQLGTNGGGFFGVNSAHPFENPTPFSNFLEMLAILLLPSALVFSFGEMVGSRKHGWCIWGAMFFILLMGLGVALWAEHALPNAWEGKEARFGITNSILWMATTTAASNGSVNCMHSSLSPLAGGIAMFNLMLGEIIFGGVGAGMYGMIMFVIKAVFIAGLMVGRTPEYLGKKIEAREVWWAIVAVIGPSAVILLGSALSCVTAAGLAALSHKGPHGLSEILYAWSSASGNNGSAFAGLNANTNFYNYGLGIAMLIGRFVVIIPVLAIAGSLSAKKQIPASPGTFPTDGFTFVALLIGTILIIGGLTFMPVLGLGPLAEHFALLQSRTF